MAGASYAAAKLVFTVDGVQARVEFVPHGEWPHRRPLAAFTVPYPDRLDSPLPAIASALRVLAEALEDVAGGR